MDLQPIINALEVSTIPEEVNGTEATTMNNVSEQFLSAEDGSLSGTGEVMELIETPSMDESFAAGQGAVVAMPDDSTFESSMGVPHYQNSLDASGMESAETGCFNLDDKQGVIEDEGTKTAIPGGTPSFGSHLGTSVDDFINECHDVLHDTDVLLDKIHDKYPGTIFRTPEELIEHASREMHEADELINKIYVEHGLKPLEPHNELKNIDIKLENDLELIRRAEEGDEWARNFIERGGCLG